MDNTTKMVVIFELEEQREDKYSEEIEFTWVGSQSVSFALAMVDYEQMAQ